MAPLATLAGLAVASVGFPAVLLALARTGRLPSPYTAARLRAAVALQWAFAAGTVGFVLLAEGRTLASVGLTPPTVLGPLVAFVVAGGATVVGGVAVQVAGIGRPDEAAVFVLAQPAHRKVGLAVTAGVTEELLYRGFLLERTLEVTGSPLLAAALSLSAFLAAHLPGRSPRTVLTRTVWLAVGLVAAYLVVRNVVVLAGVHAALDAVVLLTTDPADVLERVGESAVDDRVLALVERS